jgi:cytochrome c nitrite reductase small subunit
MRNVLIVLVIASVGIAPGIGGYTFLYAQGASYLTNSPETCANCHLMQGQYDS